MHISDDKIKLQFLNFLLETDDEIQEQFERFVSNLNNIKSDDFEEIISQLKELYHNDYYIKVLIYEQRFEELLEFVKANIDIDFSLYAKALVEVYPDEILQIVTQKCNNEMSAFGRNRSNYRAIVRMLLQVYNSSIKDELRKYNITINQDFLPCKMN